MSILLRIITVYMVVLLATMLGFNMMSGVILYVVLDLMFDGLVQLYVSSKLKE